MKHIYLSLLSITIAHTVLFAQVKIGMPAGTANPNAVLDLSNTGSGNKGVLFPLVALTATTSPSPLSAMMPGMAVYNTTFAGSGATAVVPGLYICDGIYWVLVGGSIPATYTSNTLSCGGALTGSYQIGVSTTAVNTKLAGITVASPGSYIASTNTVNGVSFSTYGVLPTNGSQTITLTAMGTPANLGTYNYSLSVAGQSCSFSVTYGGATYNCSSATKSQNPSGSLIPGVSYNGSYYIPYTNGNGASYPALSLSNQGLTLTRVAGVLSASGGVIVYYLSGQWSGNFNGIALFTTPECGNVFFGQ